jgi:DNA-directed RNA polymerase subunit RPC12/RpoP
MNLTKYICSLCGRPIDGEPHVYYIDGVRKFRCTYACDATWRAYEEPKHISDYIFNALLKFYEPMRQAGLVQEVIR